MQNIDTKLEYWKNRLIDLSKRNRLINCQLPKDGKRIQRHSLLINTPTPNELWEILMEYDSCISFPVPTQMEETENSFGRNIDESSQLFYSLPHDAAQLSLYSKSESIKIQTNQSHNETYKTLCSLKKKAKDFSEEKGLNVLYLAFGFLNWKEEGAEGQEMRSPLLLLPVKLTQEDLFSPIVLSRSDDELTANYSLEQKLLNDFGKELPRLNEEISLTDYLNEVVQAGESLSWSVSNGATQLSLFSFAKINIYNDLNRNTDKIRNNPVIRAMNGENTSDETSISDMYGYDHDSTEPKEVFSVVLADSSQQDAILLAKKGKSFVLQGPPGTGKSQTITNIIAELIAEGKKVLFVSEKTAALEVVRNNLKKEGLSPFCLSLHSHNAKRREILDQFNESIKMSRQKATLEKNANDDLHYLKEVRNNLNKYRTELHTLIEPFGKTIYQINGYLARLENHPDIDYVQAKPEHFTPEMFSRCGSALEKITQIVSISGYQQDNPWNGCILSQSTHVFRQQFIVDSQKLSSLIEEGQKNFSETNGLLDTDKDWTFASVDDVVEIYDISKRSPNVSLNWLSLDLCRIIADIDKCIKIQELEEEKIRLKRVYETACNKYNNEISNFDSLHAKCEAVRNDILVDYDENILLLSDLRQVLDIYRTKFRTWMRIFYSDYRHSQKVLISLRKTTGKLSYNESLDLLNRIVNLQGLIDQENKQWEILDVARREFEDVLNTMKNNKKELANSKYDDILEQLSKVLSISFDEVDATLKSKVEWALEFQSILTRFQLGGKYVASVCERNNEIFVQCEKNLSALRTWRAKIEPCLEKYESLFDDRLKDTFRSAPLQSLKEQLSARVNNLQGLEHQIDYRNAEEKLTELGINAYLTKAKEINLDASEIIPVFEKCFFRSMLDAVVPQFRTIRDFRRHWQDEYVELFKRLDESCLKISRAMLISKLISKLPNFDTFSSGEIGILRREIAKQRKLMPTSRLIERLNNLLPVLKPCIMMFPLSVSTYLRNANFEFDTVIFDEASQVRTEDAIGAIFRAKQVIIAGDSKQLPPTDYFNSTISASNEYEEDEEGETNDAGAFDSLLDEAALLPTQTLLWHYRSRHEHLIAFSNAKIYQGNLITFPSSVEKRDGMGVEYIYVKEGTYDRGGRNGNRAEAARVADLVFEHFRLRPEKSIGVIAFGEVQSNAIQEALNTKRREDRTFEPFFKEDREEPLFIKNLETVQGHERDTIILSIGYAPDSTGRFIMNFGPLSKNGGERRLNVAVTRARYNMKLVGSITPTDIDTERTSGEGPKLLRLYMEFAMNGINAILGEITDDEGLHFDSPFEVSVYEFLTNNGYIVATQVGCSGYRIDMAVRHPRYSGCYAIGIECDGKMYHSARTARERDRLRQEVLERMGWKIYRIWSTDWIKDYHMEKDRLLVAVNQAIEDYSNHIGVVPPSNNMAVQETDYLDVKEKTDIEIKLETFDKKVQLRSRYYYLSETEKIPLEDIAETMQRVISNSIGLDITDLLKETAKWGYGWERLTSKRKERFEQVYATLMQKRIIEEVDGKIKLKEQDVKLVFMQTFAG